MVGDSIYEKILNETKKIKTSNDVKAIRDRLKLVEILLDLYREEISNLGTYVLPIPPEALPASEQCSTTDVPW